MTATMTHGVIYGRCCMLGGKDEPLDKWSDNAVWYFLRGMQMKELYITPSILDDAQWDVLGRACIAPERLAGLPEDTVLRFTAWASDEAGNRGEASMAFFANASPDLGCATSSAIRAPLVLRLLLRRTP